MADVLNAQVRKESGTKRIRRLRDTGKIPAVLYGHKEANLNLALAADEVRALVRHGGKLVQLKGEVNDNALVREVQWDTFGMNVLHVDLMRVSAQERVRTKVSVEGRGVAPGASEGGIVEWAAHQIEIECPALSVPDILYIRLDNLHLNGAIHANERRLGHPPERRAGRAAAGRGQAAQRW
jgi:large subunit ribosomal protein L25